MGIVNVDWDIVESVDDVTKIYKKALAKADEADEPAIRVEMAEAQGQFWQRQAEQQNLRLAKRDALDKYPLAKRFESQIKGSSVAEIEASAKMFHEQIEAVTKEAAETKQQAQQDQQAIQQQAQQMYGAPAAGGGGSVGRTRDDEVTFAEQAVQRVRGKLERGEGLQRSGDKIDVGIMAAQRLREAVEFQREAHPDLGIGIGGSYKQEPQGRRKAEFGVDARVESRKNASRR